MFSKFFSIICTQYATGEWFEKHACKNKYSKWSVEWWGIFFPCWKNSWKLFPALSRKNIFSHSVFAVNEENIQSPLCLPGQHLALTKKEEKRLIAARRVHLDGAKARPVLAPRACSKSIVFCPFQVLSVSRSRFHISDALIDKHREKVKIKCDSRINHHKLVEIFSVNVEISMSEVQWG